MDKDFEKIVTRFIALWIMKEYEPSASQVELKADAQELLRDMTKYFTK
jgi:hypothetical protein